jgi:hypothetical protein
MTNNEPEAPQTAEPIPAQHQNDAEHQDIAPPSKEALDERDRRSARPRRPMGPIIRPDESRDDEFSEPADVPPTAPPE